MTAGSSPAASCVASVADSSTAAVSGAAYTSVTDVNVKLAVNAAVQAKARYVFFSKD